MTQKPFIHYTACAFLLAALTVPISAFAAYPLGLLYKTDLKQERSSDRFPRARFQDGEDKYVWGDMQLDVRPGETIECSAAVKGAKVECFYTPSSWRFTTFTSVITTIPSNNIKYIGVPDAVKVGWKATYDSSVSNDVKELNEAFAQLDADTANIAVKGAKGGRLWAYVWDFNTSWREDKNATNKEGRVGNVPKENYLNTSFFARLPNGHPVEIKLDKVSGDAFSVAGYYNLDEATEGINQSPPWLSTLWIQFDNTTPGVFLYGYEVYSKFFRDYFASVYTSQPPTGHWTKDYFLKDYLGQAPCDADNWGVTNKYLEDNYWNTSNKGFSFYFSGEIKASSSNSEVPMSAQGAFDNYARQCIEQYQKRAKDIVSSVRLDKVPLYLESPQFAGHPQRPLNNVTVTSTTATGSATCVFPTVTKTPNLTIEGLGAIEGKAQLVCENVDDSSDKIISLIDVDPNGEAVFKNPIKNVGRYHCYVERVNQFDVAFADAEQVGSMRMYEVLPTGERIPLQLNWDDSQIAKNDVIIDIIKSKSETLQHADAFRLPDDKQSPVKGSFLSSSYNPKADVRCADGENVNARCWGDYVHNAPIDNKKFGIGNGDLVNTWTYYPVSERFPFLLTVTDQPVDPQALTNGCSDGSIDPKTGKKDAKYKPTDTDGDGIPDVVEKRPGIKVYNTKTDKDSEIPAPNTDGGKPTGDANPDYDDKDTDGDGIPDKIECHFDPSHTGYGYVNGCEDTDNDGIPDYRDDDSDNDGVPDSVECIWAETNNGSNFIAGCFVTDPGTAYIPDFKNPLVKGGPQPGDGDADGDGIPDSVENKGADPSKAADKNGGQVQPGYDKDGNVDTDGDGIPDYKDTDSDNDGIPDSVECPDYATVGKCRNSDEPGTKGVTNPDDVPDYKDTDSDNDGIPDDVECIYDASNNGLDFIEGCIVTTGDNIPDYRNPNSVKDPDDTDGDGIPDKVENKEADPAQAGKTGSDGIRRDKNGDVDTDGDGTPDYKDTDSDGDGIPDRVENKGADPSKAAAQNGGKKQPGYDDDGNVDTDNDGIPNYRDTDSDGDKIPDDVECPTYKDKTTHYAGPEVDGCPDTDGNDIPDYKDTDSDNDGIPDNVENKDADPSKKGQPGYDKYGNVDTDGDGKPDYRDTDSDNDGIPDKVENTEDAAHKKNSQGVVDSDGDGIPDYRDTNSDNPSPGMTGHDPDDPSDSEECHYDSSIKSTATEKYVNGCISTEKPNDVPDYRNKATKKGDDTDGDGIPDRVEKGDDPSHPRETTPGKPDYDNKDSDGDGIPDKFECPNWSPLNVGKNYVDGCPDSDGDGKPDYRDTDSNNDGKSDKDQCAYDDQTEKCKVGTPTGFGKGGYRYVENSTGGFGIVSGGCGCASTPDDSLPGELLIVGLVGAVAISRRRKRTSVDE